MEALAPNNDARKLLLAALAIFLSILPVLCVTHLPLVDYPNHLGRLYIYQNLTTSAYLSTFYEWHWAFLPNLALDILILPFAAFLPVEQAANCVSLLALVFLCVGTVQLDRRLHGADWGVSTVVGIILYNGAFRYGFINYIIGVSLALLLFGFWIKVRPRLSGLSLCGFAAAGAFLLLMHLYAFGIYAVCVAGYELSLLLEERRPFRIGPWRDRLPLVGIGLSLLLPASLLLISPTSSDATVTRWSTWQWKAEALVSPIFFNQPYVELPLLAVVATLVGGGLLTGALTVHRRMIPALLVFAVLCAVMPRTLFGSNYADYRLLGGVSFFAVGSLKLTLRPGFWRRTFIAIGAACLLVRIASILADWIPAQSVLAEYDDALAAVPPGSRLLVLQGSAGSASQGRSPPLEHVPIFAAAKQELFVAYIFGGQQVAIKMRKPYHDYNQFAPYPEHARDMARFDYVLAVQNPKFTIPAGLSLIETGKGRTYTISKIVRAAP